MRPGAEIRHENLEKLIVEAGSAIRLAQRAGTSSSYLSQLRNRTPSPAGRPRRIGDRMAGMLERAMGKPDGWLDRPHDDREGPPEGYCPLLAWSQVHDWTEGKKSDDDGPGERFRCPIRCGPDTFVVRADSTSMIPKIQVGELLFVDPAVTPRSGRYVLVHPGPENRTTVRQLIVTDAHRYLRALNPDRPQPIVEIEDTADIRGVVIFKGERL